jgi:hypothetical protein
MKYCNRCGAKIAELRSRDMIEVMLHPELYRPEPTVEKTPAQPPAPTPTSVAAPPATPTERPQLIIMAADRPGDDVPVVEVDANPETDPPADPAPTEGDTPPESDQPPVETADSGPAGDSPAPADEASQAAETATDEEADASFDEDAITEEMNPPFDEDAITEEIDLKPPIKRSWLTYLIIGLAAVACVSLLAAHSRRASTASSRSTSTRRLRPRSRPR